MRLQSEFFGILCYGLNCVFSTKFMLKSSGHIWIEGFLKRVTKMSWYGKLYSTMAGGIINREDRAYQGKTAAEETTLLNLGPGFLSLRTLINQFLFELSRLQTLLDRQP